MAGETNPRDGIDPYDPAPGVAQGEAEELLYEWYRQWADRDDMPGKMGNALHMRTLMFFLARRLERP